jgi:hypothetical protein
MGRSGRAALSITARNRISFPGKSQVNTASAVFLLCGYRVGLLKLLEFLEGLLKRFRCRSLLLVVCDSLGSEQATLQIRIPPNRMYPSQRAISATGDLLEFGTGIPAAEFELRTEPHALIPWPSSVASSSSFR